MPVGFVMVNVMVSWCKKVWIWTLKCYVTFRPLQIREASFLTLDFAISNHEFYDFKDGVVHVYPIMRK